MFTSSVQILISRPVDEVFAFVGDVRNRPRWDDSVETEELTSPEPIGVGSTVRTRLRSMVIPILTVLACANDLAVDSGEPER